MRLVRTILQRTAVPRLRLSSIEPWDLIPELLDLWPNERLCRQVHLSLQSGCDKTLRRMGRKYTTADFYQFVKEVRQRVPQISITSDIIVGFPGETDKEFAKSVSFIKRMEFARLHVFRYSLREGTRAAKMTGQVDPRITKVRSKRLLDLGQRGEIDFHRRFLQSEVEVLFESSQREGDTIIWNGLTDNYLRISVGSQDSLENRFGLVRCLTADAGGLKGELISPGKRQVRHDALQD